MGRTKFTARRSTSPPKFYVKITNDVSQSNCKLADDNVSIEATKIINIGEEIQLYLGRPNIDDIHSDNCDDNLSDNNDSSNDDDDESSDDCDDNSNDNNDSSNDDDDSSDNNDDYDDNFSDNNDPSDLEKRSTGDKCKRKRKRNEYYTGGNLKRSDNYDDISRDNNDRLDLEKKSTGNKCEQREELSEDDVKEIRSLNFAKRQVGVKIALAKTHLEFYEKKVEEMNAKENVILGKGNKFSQDEWYQLQILGDEIPQYEVNKAMAKKEIDFWVEQIQEIVDKTNFILGGVVDSEETEGKYEYAERRAMSSTYWMKKGPRGGGGCKVHRGGVIR